MDHSTKGGSLQQPLKATEIYLDPLALRIIHVIQGWFCQLLRYFSFNRSRTAYFSDFQTARKMGKYFKQNKDTEDTSVNGITEISFF